MMRSPKLLCLATSLAYVPACTASPGDDATTTSDSGQPDNNSDDGDSADGASSSSGVDTITGGGGGSSSSSSGSGMDSTGDGDGDGDPSGDGDGDGDPDCNNPIAGTVLAPFEFDQNFGGLVAPVAFDGSDEYVLTLATFGVTTSVGTIDLGSGDNANYITCTECALVFATTAGAGIWYQVEGTLTLTAFAGIDASAGTLSGLRMIEVIIDNDFTSTPVPGGSCIEFADDITWDFVGGDGDGDGDSDGTSG